MLPELAGHAIDTVRAARRRYGELRRVDRGSRERLLDVQTRRLDSFLAFAAEHSPFYRGRWGGRAPRAGDLEGLEPLSRTELVRHTDDILTDRSLTRTRLYELLEKPGRHSHVVCASSGTTGEPVIVPFSRHEWCEGYAYYLRGVSRWAPTLLDMVSSARRVAGIVTCHPHHISTQLAAPSTSVPWGPLIVPAGRPREELIDQIGTYRPSMLTGYPSAIDLLARAQLAGELDIAPRKVLTSGETLPVGFRERVRSAWQTDAFDVYGMTEAHVFAFECAEHNGMHIDEDVIVLEVVDEQDLALPPGEPGAAVLVTGLLNRTLPIIRYRVGDRLRITEDPCPCGLPSARIVSVDGRQGEWLELATVSGTAVRLRPSVVEGPLTTRLDVQRFQLRNGGGACHVLVVSPHPGADLEEEIRQALVAALAPHEVRPDAVSVAIVEVIDHEHGGTDKRRRVVPM